MQLVGVRLDGMLDGFKRKKIDFGLLYFRTETCSTTTPMTAASFADFRFSDRLYKITMMMRLTPGANTALQVQGSVAQS